MTTLAYNFFTRKHLCIVLSLAIVGLLGLYMYLVSVTVLHVVMYTETTQSLKKVTSDIGALENRLIMAQHKVSAEIASLEGYTEITNKTFIDRRPTSLVLSDQGGR